jgi:hypothetical protein
MQMRLKSAGQVMAAMPVAFSNGIKENIRFAMNRPVDFVVSTAFSMGTFMVVKHLALQALLGIALGPVATPIVAGMLAAALITSVRGVAKQKELGEARAAQLMQNMENPPTPEQLARARKVNISQVLGAAGMHMVFSGLIGSLFTFVVPELFDGIEGTDQQNEQDSDVTENGSPKTGFEMLKDDFLGEYYEARGGPFEYDHRVSGTNQLGAYAISTDQLQELGYYEDPRPVAQQDLEIKDEYWTGKEGIKSLEGFYAEHELQDQILLDKMNQTWAKIVEYGLDEKYAGKMIGGLEITPERLLAGAMKYGVEPQDITLGVGIDHHLTEAQADPDNSFFKQVVSPKLEKFDHNNFPYRPGIADGVELVPEEVQQPPTEGNQEPPPPKETVPSQPPIFQPDTSANEGVTKIQLDQNLSYNMGALGRTDYDVIIVEDFKDILLKKDGRAEGVPTEDGYLLTLNGPLFDNAKGYLDTEGNRVQTTYGQTTGMLVVDGKEVRPFFDPQHPRFFTQTGRGTITVNFADNNGVIGQMANGDPFLMTADEWQAASIEAEDLDWAIQNGGVLLDQGANPHSAGTESLKERTAMGFTPDGKLVIIHADQVNQHHLGEISREHGAVDAMFLDGVNVGYSIPGQDQSVGKILNRSTVFHIR